MSQPEAILVAGVVSALAAIITSLAANVVSHMLATRGQDRRRWDERRMQAYADYARAVKSITTLSARTAGGRGLPYSLQPLSVDEGTPALALAEHERAEHWEAVLLLGSTSAVRAARDWHHCAWLMVEFAHGRRTDPDEWEEAIKRNDEARATFYHEARRDLAVRGGPLPANKWPPDWATHKAETVASPPLAVREAHSSDTKERSGR